MRGARGRARRPRAGDGRRRQHRRHDGRRAPAASAGSRACTGPRSRCRCRCSAPDRPQLLVDGGATVDPHPEWLVEWARARARVRAGAARRRRADGRAALERRGAGQGRRAAQGARRPLLADVKGFVGNVEGRDLLRRVGRRDRHRRLHRQRHAEDGRRRARRARRPGVRRGRRAGVRGSVADALKLRLLEAAAPLLPDNTGGALLLGVNGVCIISHGSSSATAIVNAVRVARDCVTADVVERLAVAARDLDGGRVADARRDAQPPRSDRPRPRSSGSCATSSSRSSRSIPTRSRPTARLRDDLDADDFALIELVEAVDAELGERMVGLSIDDDDLVEWRTVRDAVECGRRAGTSRSTSTPTAWIGGGVVTERPPTPRCRVASRERRRSTSSRPRSASHSTTARCCSARSRTARGARRTASRRRTNGSSSSATPCSVSSSRTTCSSTSRTSPRGSSPRCAAGVVNARVLAEVALELDLGAAPAARQGRGRGRRAGEAVDPRRRVRGGGRRGLSRPRLRDHPRPRAALPRATASPRPPPAPAAATTRPVCRSSPRPARSDGPATSCATRAPTTRSTSSRTCSSATSAYGEGEGRSKKQAEQAAAWVAWTRLARDEAARASGRRGDGDAGAT